MGIWDSIKGHLSRNRTTYLGGLEEALKFGASWLPGGNLIAKGIEKGLGIVHQTTDRVKDVLSDRRVTNLEGTAQGLKTSQGILQGQLTEVQAGLDQGKLAQEALTQALNELNQDLINSTAENKRLLEEQKKFLEELIQANQEKVNHLQQVQAEFQEQLNRNEQMLAILNNKVADLDGKVSFTEEEIAKLNSFAEQTKQRFDNLEKRTEQLEIKQNEHEQRLNDFDAQFQHLEQELNSIKQAQQQNNQELNQQRQSIQTNQAELAQLQAIVKSLQDKEQARQEQENLQSLLKQKENELTNKLTSYYHLKEIQKDLERQLQQLQGIPTEFPDIQQELNLKTKLFTYFDSILNHWTSEQIITGLTHCTITYPITPEQYQAGLTKFGTEAMSFFEPCADWEDSNNPLPTSEEIDNLFNNFNQLFFQNSQITEEEFFVKKDLINKLQSNHTILNEMATELGFSEEKIDDSLLKYNPLANNDKPTEQEVITDQQQGTVGAVAPQHLPLILGGLFIFLLIVYLVFKSSKKEYQNSQKNSSNKSQQKFWVWLGLVGLSLLGVGSFLLSSDKPLIEKPIKTTEQINPSEENTESTNNQSKNTANISTEELITWQVIDRNFNAELIIEWKTRKFTPELTKSWQEALHNDFSVNDYSFVSWLRDIKQLSPKQVSKSSNLTQLRQEFSSYSADYSHSNNSRELKHKLKVVEEKKVIVDYSTINESNFHNLNNEQQLKYLEFVKNRFAYFLREEEVIIFDQPSYKEAEQTIIIGKTAHLLCKELNCQVIRSERNKWCKYHNCEGYNCKQLKAGEKGFYHKYCVNCLRSKSYDKLTAIDNIDNYQTMNEKRHSWRKGFDWVDNLVGLERFLEEKFVEKEKEGKDYSGYFREKLLVQ